MVISKHTILLTQNSTSLTSRRYSDYETTEEAMDAVCQMFESRLKRLKPAERQITYDIKDLYDFIDQLPDAGVLVWNESISAYIPKSKEWIKQGVLKQLTRQAQK